MSVKSMYVDRRTPFDVLLSTFNWVELVPSPGFPYLLSPAAEIATKLVKSAFKIHLFFNENAVKNVFGVAFDD